jgi:hypothetical protein
VYDVIGLPPLEGVLHVITTLFPDTKVVGCATTDGILAESIVTVDEAKL